MIFDPRKVVGECHVHVADVPMRGHVFFLPRVPKLLGIFIENKQRQKKKTRGQLTQSRRGTSVSSLVDYHYRWTFGRLRVGAFVMGAAFSAVL